MSRLVLVERTFATHGQADRWFDSLRATAWPYVWCEPDLRNRRWRVRALIEQARLPVVGTETDFAGRPYGSRRRI